MDLRQDETIATLTASLLRGMRAYRVEAEPRYEEVHVQECGEVLDRHLKALSTATDATVALDLVRETVLELNALNNTCDGELIETDQREDICAILIRAGSLGKFNSEDEDITEPWRDW